MKEMVFTKADKENMVIVLNTTDYVHRTLEFLDSKYNPSLDRGKGFCYFMMSAFDAQAKILNTPKTF